MTRAKNSAIFRELLIIAVVAGCVYGIIYALASTHVAVLVKRLPIMLILIVLGRHFFKTTICYIANAVILIGGIFLVWGMRYICQLKLVDVAMMNELHVWLSVFFMVIVLINLLDKSLYRGITTFVLLGSWLLMCFIYPLYFTAENGWFSADAVLAIMQSNTEETSSYLVDHVTLSGILVLVLFLTILSAIICMNIKYGGIKKISRKFYVVMVIMVLCSVGNAANMTLSTKHIQESYVVGSFVGAKKQQAEYDKFKEQLSNRNSLLQGMQVTGDNAEGLYVLVIGESQTREHMSAFGYKARETTPWLKQMMDKGRVISFKNAYSCHTHTVQVLTYALTAKNQYNDRKVESSASIIDVAKAAGYRTIWLSNQSHYGIYDTPISVIADSADEKLFIEHNISGTGTDYYDGDLIPQLDKLPLDGKTLLVVHLMGCHGAYADRYPSEAGKFEGTDSVALYDNAVYYNDMVMKELYEKLSQRYDFQGIIYFADHGEEPVKLGHNWGSFVACMAKIPMYMIFSPTFQERYGDRYTTLQEHRDEYFTNDLIYNTVLGIMGLQEAGSYEPGNDISNRQYDGNVARFTTGYGKKYIQEIIK